METRAVNRSRPADIRRAALITAVVVALEITTVFIGWSMYTSGRREPAWGGVIGHTVFWTALLIATVWAARIAYLKGHHRFRWLARYVVYAVVSLAIFVAGDLWRPDFSPTDDAPWTLVFAPLLGIWVWSVLAAPLVLGVCAIVAFAKANRPALPDSWWHIHYDAT